MEFGEHMEIESSSKSSGIHMVNDEELYINNRKLKEKGMTNVEYVLHVFSGGGDYTTLIHRVQMRKENQRVHS
jgi:hypothetical protein